MTPEDVAEELQLNIKTVQKLCRDGEIPAIKIAQQWRIPKDRFDQWLEDKMKGGD